MKEVSVIIPNYNNARWLAGCLNSCLQQEYLKEIIVIDDHSTDNSWNLLQKLAVDHPILKIYKNPQKGANTARNYGFEKSSGEFIQWLDADDFVLSGKFKAQINSLEKKGGDIAYCDYRLDYYKSNDFQYSEEKIFQHYDDFAAEILKDNWLASHCYLVRREIAEKIANEDGWNPNTKVGQDREYFTMAALIGAKFVYVPGIFAVYNRWSTQTISGIEFKQRLELNQILEKKFREKIVKSSYNKDVKKKYFNILNTHKIKACYYNSSIQIDQPFSLLKLKWNLIHYKMRIVIPFIYIHKHLNYFWNKTLKNA